MVVAITGIIVALAVREPLSERCARSRGARPRSVALAIENARDAAWFGGRPIVGHVRRRAAARVALRGDDVARRRRARPTRSTASVRVDRPSTWTASRSKPDDRLVFMPDGLGVPFRVALEVRGLALGGRGRCGRARSRGGARDEGIHPHRDPGRGGDPRGRARRDHARGERRHRRRARDAPAAARHVGRARTAWPSCARAASSPTPATHAHAPPSRAASRSSIDEIVSDTPNPDHPPRRPRGRRRARPRPRARAGSRLCLADRNSGVHPRRAAGGARDLRDHRGLRLSRPHGDARQPRGAAEGIAQVARRRALRGPRRARPRRGARRGRAPGGVGHAARAASPRRSTRAAPATASRSRARAARCRRTRSPRRSASPIACATARVERLTWSSVDAAPARRAHRGRRSSRVVRALDLPLPRPERGEWRPTWGLPGTDERLPAAVEMTLTLASGERIVRLVDLPTGDHERTRARRRRHHRDPHRRGRRLGRDAHARAAIGDARPDDARRLARAGRPVRAAPASTGRAACCTQDARTLQRVDSLDEGWAQPDRRAAGRARASSPAPSPTSRASST